MASATAVVELVTRKRKARGGERKKKKKKKQSILAAQTDCDQSTKLELAHHTVHSTNQGLTDRQGFQGHVINDANAVSGAMQRTIQCFSQAGPGPHDKGQMLCSQGAQHNRASMLEQDQGIPQPSLLLHRQTKAPRGAG